VVSNDEICGAIKDIFEDQRSVLEPAGALAFAGLKRYLQRHRLKNAQLIAIASGANVNFDRLRHVAERAEIGERREAILAVTIPEQPGSFRKFCAAIGNHSITEFNYRYSDTKSAHVFVGVQISDGKETKRLIANLRKHGYQTLDMIDNEMAKLHIRHLVGGRAPNAMNPGALRNFLNKMGQTWNISLFHYRNHGADFGRVLVGMQVPPQEKKQFQAFLDSLGYAYVEESDNPAYKLFLS
jgi:threonine dehydratase